MTATLTKYRSRFTTVRNPPDEAPAKGRNWGNPVAEAQRRKQMSEELEDIRRALDIVRRAIHATDDFGKRDLYRVEYYLCKRAEESQQVAA